MNLDKKAYELRLDVLEMVFNHKSGHIGGSFSSMNILTALYYAVMDDSRIKAGDPARDRFILSKGHNAEALYAVLADRGFFDKSELDTFTCFGTRLAEHPSHKLPGVEVSTGALGHGLSIGVGLAIGLKTTEPESHVYVLMGDGELAEGSVWEAAMSAGKYGLSNLTAIIDRNRLQISGCTEEVMPLDDLTAKLKAFGFAVCECDGNSCEELIPMLKTRVPGKPVAVIANTVKGYGSEVIENKAGWHHAIPNEEQYKTIKEDLKSRMAALDERSALVNKGGVN
jgi:transketolase